MKKIGIVGGLSWESTALYYRLINEGIRKALGGLNSGQILINSVNFAEVMKIQEAGGWEALGKYLLRESRALIAAGADYIFLGANTVHKVAAMISDEIDVPLIHIVDVVGEILQKKQVTTCALLGTKFTMVEPFFTEKLQNDFAVGSIIPEDMDRDFIHRIIYDELSMGKIKKVTKKKVISIIEGLKSKGAEVIVLGCTELGLLIKNEDVTVDIIDTVKAHAGKAVELLLQ